MRSICYKPSFTIFILIHVFIYCIYLFLATLGPHCCTQACPVSVSRGYCIVVVCALLIVVTSLLQRTGSRA